MHFLTAQDAPVAANPAQATTQTPPQEQTPFERVFLKDDKFLVVIGVVVIIWIGILAFLFRTDRKIAALDAALDERDGLNDV